MDFFKKKINRIGRKMSLRNSLNSQDDIFPESDNATISTVDIYRPSSSSQKSILKQPIVAKHTKSHSHKSSDDAVLKQVARNPLAVTVYAKPIQNDIAVRFEYIATSGLSNDQRKELVRAYLPPVNCKLIEAPSLNPEIRATITDAIYKRDTAIYNKQKQISCAIACLGEAITLLLSKDSKDPTMLKLLMDTGRILCDSQHIDSVTRRNYIIGVLKGELKDQVLNAKIDSMLFGKELNGTLKSAGKIKRSSDNLKVRFSSIKASVNKSKAGCSKNNPEPPSPISKICGRTKAPIAEYTRIVVPRESSPRSSKQISKVDIGQRERLTRESRSRSYSPQRR